MSIINIQYYKSPYGELILGAYGDELCLADWRYRKMRTSIDQRIKSGLNAEFEESKNCVIDLAIFQLEEYFRKERKMFAIPLLLVGTDFQKEVWNELLKIPYGKTESYLGLSKKMNNEGAIRAVASANGANAISIIIPCHRIIGSDGDLTGYAGGLQAKEKLLQMEGAFGQMSLF
jgi:methylated-DNA-[protein]-cysteine S-methyltransferase